MAWANRHCRAGVVGPGRRAVLCPPAACSWVPAAWAPFQPRSRAPGQPLWGERGRCCPTPGRLWVGGQGCGLPVLQGNKATAMSHHSFTRRGLGGWGRGSAHVSEGDCWPASGRGDSQGPRGPSSLPVAGSRGSWGARALALGLDPARPGARGSLPCPGSAHCPFAPGAKGQLQEAPPRPQWTLHCAWFTWSWGLDLGL